MAKKLSNKEKKRQKAFEKAARPMIKYLCENHDPYATVIVTNTRAELFQTSMMTPRIEDYIIRG